MVIVATEIAVSQKDLTYYKSSWFIYFLILF